MKFLIYDAIASEKSSSPQENLMSLILMLIVFSLIIYFMIIRPQQNRNKEHKKLINSIEKGDEVLTSGGLVGRVVKVTNNGYITIALNDITEVTIKNNFITTILPKGTIKKL